MLRLKDLMEDHDLKQEEIAKILNISQTNYSKYELEKVNIPISSLIVLADFCNTSTGYLIGLTDEIKPYSRSSKIS